jgi:hypothetical protein
MVGSMNTTTNAQPALVPTYSGGCHCGRLRYEAEIDLGAGVGRCNCSICTKLATAGAIIAPSAFRVTAGHAFVGRYELSLAPNHRVFCTHCGTHVWGAGEIPELGGAFVSVNVNTLDDVEPMDLAVHYWDGRHNNWQAGPRATPWRIRPEDEPRF